MVALRQILHVLVAGAAVFASSVAILFELESTHPRFGVVALLAFLGAWAGASTLLRSIGSVALSFAGVVALGFVHGDVRVAELLLTNLWAIVLWERLDAPAPVEPGLAASARPSRRGR